MIFWAHRSCNSNDILTLYIYCERVLRYCSSAVYTPPPHPPIPQPSKPERSWKSWKEEGWVQDRLWPSSPQGSIHILYILYTHTGYSVMYLLIVSLLTTSCACCTFSSLFTLIYSYIVSAKFWKQSTALYFSYPLPIIFHSTCLGTNSSFTYFYLIHRQDLERRLLERHNLERHNLEWHNLECDSS